MPSPSAPADACRARPLLGTFVEVRAGGDGDAVDMHRAIDAAFGAVEHVHRLMSFHDPDSDVSRLNRQAHLAPVQIDPQTYAVLEAAQEIARRSDGAFDITIAPQLEQWHLLPNGPGPVSPQGGWHDIELCGGERVRFHRPLRIDLGGIAKGYAVDRAVDALRRAGAHRGLVNAGGDARAFGPSPYRVGLRDPRQPSRVAQVLPLREQALATSAAYFSRRTHAEQPVSALLDPRSRKPYTAAGSISVRAGECLVADALTKVVLFADPGTAACLLTANGACSFVLQADPSQEVS